MSAHDTTRFRHRRRAQDIPGCESLRLQAFRKAASDCSMRSLLNKPFPHLLAALAGSSTLPWPRNRSGEPSTIAELLAEPKTPSGAGRGRRMGNACYLYCGAAGCGPQLKGEWRAGRPGVGAEPAKIYRAGKVFLRRAWRAPLGKRERQQC